MSEMIYAMGCANGAAMRAIPVGSLAALSEDEMVCMIIPHVGKAPMATSRQLQDWAMSANDDAGLGELGRWKGWKKLKNAVKKVAKIAVAPIKAVAKSVQHAATEVKRYAPQALTALVGVVTMQPALLQQAAAGVVKQKMSSQAAKQQQKEITKANAQAQAEYDALVAQAMQPAVPVTTAPAKPVTATAPAKTPAAAVYPAYQAPVNNGRPGNAASSNGMTVPAPVPGVVTRLNAETGPESPRIVGMNWKGLMDNIKANPVPWAIGAGGLLLILRR